jgi:alkaline phosphatase D
VTLSRRQFIWTATAAGLAWPAIPSAQTRTRRFAHGVASGDPQANAVILWTRVTPAAGATQPVEVRWTIGSDAALTRTVRSGMATATMERDFTVKVDATGLEPGRTYYYAFDAGGERSPVGRTKTLPVAAISQLRLALLSCANYPAGFFNVYRMVAEREDLDAVIHVGDYIYEFANGVYGDGTALKRLPRPLKEAVALADYRQRYAVYHEDADLQEAHRQHPFIAIWDDHELANDAWSGGAANHNPESGEGGWPARQAAAWRAYMEWMPIREQSANAINLYRSFRFGSLADLVMLDTRTARDRQAAPDDLAAINSPQRRMIDSVQESWLFDTLRGSQRAGIPWRLVGQQVLFSRLVPQGRSIQFTDVWDGYQAARERLLDFFQREQARNVAILTGDLHSSWAFDVPRNPWGGYRPQTGAGSLAVEIVGPAISSPALMAPDQAPSLIAAARVALPTLKYIDGLRQGYVLLDLTAQRLRADWYHAATVLERSTTQRLAASFVCESGTAHLTPA